ncbi:MAG: NADP-dependent isocitrate dehydrogenase [Vicinamibacteria bacterium]|nr:NADP-dependent isocitrate dehydrogenase [Vicinamibacteria bacterium]
MATAPAFAPVDAPVAPRTAHTVAVAAGDGIGPEIMDATLAVLREAGAGLDVVPVEVGERVYRRGVSSGIDREAWDAITGTGVLLKGPITTPQGKGYKSVNVTLRKTLGLFANVRPCVALHPHVRTKHPEMDVVIVRENEEDTYAGIEHRQTDEVVQCLKLVTRPGCERIVRYAFEHARANGRKKVSCFTKDNIMKLTDGLFHRVFDEVAAEYPDLRSEHLIVDIGTARLADDPGRFDVIVTPNLYGDILSDVAAQIAGSVGLAGSANVGNGCALFEAIHGSAPDIAGQGIANPSGLLMSAVMMLVHLGRTEQAARVHNAWLRTLEEGIHTADIHDPATSRRRVGTRDFAAAVIARLGRVPETRPAVAYAAAPRLDAVLAPPAAARRALKQFVGIDVFLHWDEANRDPRALGAALEPLSGPEFALKMITNRGVKVYPEGLPQTFCTDHWRCRFVLRDGQRATGAPLRLLTRLAEHGHDVVKTENLYRFDGEPGYSMGQGE